LTVNVAHNRQNELQSVIAEVGHDFSNIKKFIKWSKFVDTRYEDLRSVSERNKRF
jgi:hypothetical protein